MGARRSQMRSLGSVIQRCPGLPVRPVIHRLLLMAGVAITGWLLGAAGQAHAETAPGGWISGAVAHTGESVAAMADRVPAVRTVEPVAQAAPAQPIALVVGAVPGARLTRALPDASIMRTLPAGHVMRGLRGERVMSALPTVRAVRGLSVERLAHTLPVTRVVRAVPIVRAAEVVQSVEAVRTAAVAHVTQIVRTAESDAHVTEPGDLTSPTATTPVTTGLPRVYGPGEDMVPDQAAEHGDSGRSAGVVGGPVRDAGPHAVTGAAKKVTAGHAVRSRKSAPVRPRVPRPLPRRAQALLPSMGDGAGHASVTRVIRRGTALRRPTAHALVARAVPPAIRTAADEPSFSPD